MLASPTTIELTALDVTQAPEKTFSVLVRGMVSLIELSSYAQLLLRLHKPSIDRVLASPNALDHLDVALRRHRQEQLTRVQSSVASEAAVESAPVLSTRSKSTPNEEVSTTVRLALDSILDVIEATVP